MTMDGRVDPQAIMAVMATAFAPTFGEAWSAAQVAGSLASGTAWADVARDAGGPVGFTLCRQIGPEAELLLIGVAPAARRTGTGRRLLQGAIEEARRRLVTTMFLEVRDGNTAALALYRSAEFAVIGRRRDYYRGSDGSRFDALTLRRQIGDQDRWA